MPSPRSFAAWTFLCLILSAILFLPPFVGLADNSDYARAVQPLGLVAGEHPRYFHAFREFRLTDAAAGSLRRLLLPDVENELGYVSSQLLLAKAALLMNDTVKRVLQADPTVFDIRFLGVLYIALYAVGLTLFVTKLGAKRAFARMLAFVATILVFCDVGYILYFHSFYGEAAILVSLLLTAGSVLWCVSGGTPPKRALLLFYASSFLFVSAKVANAPIGLLLAAFGVLLLPLRTDKAYRAIGVVGSASLLLFSILFYASTPAWMKQVNQYQAIFFGVLKDSPAPDEDLASLGLPPKYASLAGTHGYMPEAPYDIYGETFAEEVYEQATYSDILAFYAMHPVRLLEKLRVSADASVFLRPTYLGNYEPDAGRERLSFTERFSLWESLRKRAVGKAFPIVLAVFACYSAAIAFACFRRFGREGRRRRDARSDAGLGAGTLLAAAALVQFVVPVLGNGEADLQKHMFLFALCFDLMLVVGAVWLADRVRAKHAAILMAALMLIPVAQWARGTPAAPASAVSELRIGDAVSLGRFDGEPLLWTVIAKEDEGSLLWLRDAIAMRPFDAFDEALPAASPFAAYGSNAWEASDVRRWLNEDFLLGFAEDERRLLNGATLKTLASTASAQRERIGEQPHYWSPLPRDAEQNYDLAYGRRANEFVFLLDAQQLSRFVARQGVPTTKTNAQGDVVPYWVRTPYANSPSMVRVVGADGFVYHQDASHPRIGVVPAAFLRSDAAVQSGLGTPERPYRMAGALPLARVLH